MRIELSCVCELRADSSWCLFLLRWVLLPRARVSGKLAQSLIIRGSRGLLGPVRLSALVIVTAFFIFGNTSQTCFLTLLLPFFIFLTSKSLASIHVEDQIVVNCNRLSASRFLDLFFVNGKRALSNFLGWLILQDLADSDGLSFITESEAAQLREDVVLLKRNGDSHLDAANDLGETASELGSLLLNNITSIVFLI